MLLSSHVLLISYLSVPLPERWAALRFLSRYVTGSAVTAPALCSPLPTPDNDNSCNSTWFQGRVKNVTAKTGHIASYGGTTKPCSLLPNDWKCLWHLPKILLSPSHVWCNSGHITSPSLEGTWRRLWAVRTIHLPTATSLPVPEDPQHRRECRGKVAE